jgi:hypothetical protein
MALAKEAKDWPEDFFSAFEEEKDLRLLREAAEDMEKAILGIGVQYCANALAL